MLIRTETTPNPHALKFLPDIEIAGANPKYFNDLEQAKLASNLAYKLLSIEEVIAVFFGNDFVTITKSDAVDWNVLKTEILIVMMDHLTMKLPIFNPAYSNSTTPNSATASAIEQQIIEIIETRVRPAVARDGGDIIYHGFENGIVKLELHGSCAGCPSASITLKQGIESMLKHFIPEVEGVEAVEV